MYKQSDVSNIRTFQNVFLSFSLMAFSALPLPGDRQSMAWAMEDPPLELPTDGRLLLDVMMMMIINYCSIFSGLAIYIYTYICIYI